MNQDIDQSLLPVILQEICGLIGIQATMAIVQEYGGLRLYVPQEIPQDHPLMRLVGVCNAIAIVDEFGGLTLEIPRAEAAIRRVRDTEIRTMSAALSHRELAIKYKTTERHIRRILAGYMHNNNQMELF